MKRIETLLNIFFMVACITHVSFIGYYTINPELPEIKIYSKPLKDIEFPLVFRLCTNKLLNLNHSEFNLMRWVIRILKDSLKDKVNITGNTLDGMDIKKMDQSLLLLMR